MLGHSEDETERLPRNVSNYKSTLRNIPEERALTDTAVEARNHVSVKVILFSGVECITGGSRAACSSFGPSGDPRNFSKHAANTAQR